MPEKEAIKLANRRGIKGLLIGTNWAFCNNAIANKRMVDSISSNLKNQEKCRNASKSTLLKIAKGREQAYAFYTNSKMK